MVNTTPATAPQRRKLRVAISGEVVLLRLCLIALGLFLVVGLLLSAYTLLSKGVQDTDGNFVGLQYSIVHFNEHHVSVTLFNSLRISVMSKAFTWLSPAPMSSR